MKHSRLAILGMLLTALLALGGQGAEAAPLTIEGNEGSVLTIGRNSMNGVVFVHGYGGRWQTSGTLVWLPIAVFDSFCSHALHSLELVPPSAPLDTAQTIFAAPVVVKDGIGGVVMISVTRQAASEEGGPQPLLTVFAKRGDEEWDSRATFSGARLRTLLQALRTVNQ